QWKWRDKNGVQYSDLPPPSGVAEADILQRPSAATRKSNAPLAAAPASAASGAPVLAPKTVDSELEAKHKKAEEEAAAKRKADEKAEETRVAAAKADNCTRAQAQLRTLDSGVRLAQLNEKGERIVMDDTARASESKRARDMIAQNCAR
ncbi:MAG: DUF4124 domain-containing protein, partial [Burkholderiales bacterium]